MTSKHTDLVSTFLLMATWRRDHDGMPGDQGLIMHSDDGARYTSVKVTGHLALEVFTASIGSVRDAYDDALMENVIGLYKAKCNHPGLPRRAVTD